MAPPSLSLYGSNIKTATRVKFLGVLFDNRLSYAPHIKQLKTDCQRPLDLLRLLSHKTWGADQNTLLHLYSAMVRAKLDYGCVVYGQASPGLLKLLDPVQNEGLRIAGGSF